MIDTHETWIFPDIRDGNNLPDTPIICLIKTIINFLLRNYIYQFNKPLMITKGFKVN